MAVIKYHDSTNFTTTAVKYTVYYLHFFTKKKVICTYCFLARTNLELVKHDAVLTTDEVF